MRKKAPLTVERKNSKGGFASEQTPHPSSCPPLAADRPRPFRCSSFSHTNRFAGFAWEPCPFANPLKRPRRGLRPPPLDFPRGLVCAEFVFRLSKRATDASLIDRRGSRNTLRLFRMYLAWKSVCARYAIQPLQEGRPFDFHTSNIQRAQTKRLARYIVRLGNPIRRPPEGRSLPGALSVNGTQKQSAFSGATAPFASPAPLFSPFFSGKTEKNGPPEAFRAIPAQKRYGSRSGGDGAANRSAPSAHPK